MKRPHIIHSILLLILLFFINTGNAEKKKSKHYVKVSDVNYQTKPQTINAIGYMIADNQVSIYNQVEGVLINLPFNIGDSVSSETVIASLEPRLKQLENEKALILLKQKRVDLDRLKKLSRNKLVSHEILSQAETDLQLAQIDAKVTQEHLNYTKITSPVSGTIAQLLVKQGDVLAKHSHIMTIYDNSQYIIEFSLPESQLSTIKLHDSIEVALSNSNNKITQKSKLPKTYKAFINAIYPQINLRNRLVTFRAKLETTPLLKLSGLSVEITHKSKSAKFLSIPISSIRQDELNSYVFSYNDKTHQVKKQIVTLGKTLDQQIEVLSGLTYNDKVVYKGIYKLKSGQKVLIEN